MAGVSWTEEEYEEFKARSAKSESVKEVVPKSDGGERTQTLVLPRIGPSLNQWYAGAHWSKRQKTKKRWRALVAREGKGLAPVQSYPVQLSVTCVFGYKSRSYDASNLAATAKLAEDGLVSSGVLEDDSNKYVSTVELHSIKRSEGEDHTIIEIIER